KTGHGVSCSLTIRPISVLKIGRIQDICALVALSERSLEKALPYLPAVPRALVRASDSLKLTAYPLAAKRPMKPAGDRRVATDQLEHIDQWFRSNSERRPETIAMYRNHKWRYGKWLSNT